MGGGTTPSWPEGVVHAAADKRRKADKARFHFAWRIGLFISREEDPDKFSKPLLKEGARCAGRLRRDLHRSSHN